MRKIFHYGICDDDIGEADAFFEVVNGTLTLLAAWACNDAMYRGEYMDSLFKAVGVEVTGLPKTHTKKATKIAKEFFGV